MCAKTLALHDRQTGDVRAAIPRRSTFPHNVTLRHKQYRHGPAALHAASSSETRRNSEKNTPRQQPTTTTAVLSIIIWAYGLRDRVLQQ